MMIVVIPAVVALVLLVAIYFVAKQVEHQHAMLVYWMFVGIVLGATALSSIILFVLLSIGALMP